MNTKKINAVSVIQKIAMLSVLVALTGAQHCQAAADPRDDDSHSIFLTTERTSDNPMINAILNNDMTELERLLDTGANANMIVNNQSLLDEAIMNGRGRAVDILLRYGASRSINRLQSGNRTPLMYATLVGNPYIVQALLQAGADATIADDDGRTALMFAALQSNPDISNQMVTDLLNKGANPNRKDEKKHTALDLAIKTHNKKVIKTIEDWYSKNQ